MTDIPTLKFNESGWCKALGKSYREGLYQPQTKEEYEALAPFAENARPLGAGPPVQEPVAAAVDSAPQDGPLAPAPGPDIESADKDELMAYAKQLGLKPPSNIGIDKLRAQIAERLSNGE